MTIPTEKLAKDIVINEIKIRELEKEIALIKEKLEIKDILGEMINRIDRRLSLYIYEQENKEGINIIDFQKEVDFRLNEFRKENQSLSGNIRTLEEQHQIMHNFLVEINKYLVTIVDKIESLRIFLGKIKTN